MLKARVGAARGAVYGALILAGAVGGAIMPSGASAAADGQGIGLQYSAPVGYVKVCGDNQNGQAACLTQSLRVSSPAPSSETAWFVDGQSQPIYQAAPPATSPRWWWLGQVHIWMWTDSSESQLVGDTVCVVPKSLASGNWWRCKYVTVSPSPPPPPSPPPTPPSPSPILPPRPAATPPASGAHGRASADVSAVRREYRTMLLAEIGPRARAVCSQLTPRGRREYTRGVSSCPAVFAGNRQALRAKIPPATWRKLAAIAVAHLSVNLKLTNSRATATDRSGVFSKTELIRAGGGWKFASGPPLPRPLRPTADHRDPHDA